LSAIKNGIVHLQISQNRLRQYPFYQQISPFAEPSGSSNVLSVRMTAHAGPKT
jgi:hypothetical protein